ncbi:MAG: phosphoglucosamine mutase [Deltaproteobacteria bacterium]|uniref:Phosphoglucosamine mutase n=1 Tax=Candidatus Zymogenus saltonus TaxID=2844893 RepID=A0A9D8PSD4_9DELT|nr:phosphoglucosamine mutase [Candidatus Zymogenus saltonus]
MISETKRLFGTDGIRGVANEEPMTTETAMKVGRATAYIFKDSNRRHRIVIGKDTRLSGYMLETAMASGICSMGVDVLLVGPLPTPGIAFITSSMRADAGVVISASHNPFQDNGIKIFSGDGFKLPDKKELEIEELIFSNKIDELRPTAQEVGKAFRVDDAVGRYVVFLKATFPKDLDLTGMTIAVDCAHGAAYRVAPSVFEELGAKVITIGDEPNGENINDKFGSLYPEVISKVVKENRADIGIALDGDADRVIVVDENGVEVNGDQIMAICAREKMENKELVGGVLVATVMSNMGLELFMKEIGGRLVRTPVGDRYVVEKMVKGGYSLGGERSGHLIFINYNTTGDGILSALKLLSVMVRKQKKLSELSGIMTEFPQVLKNVMVREKVNLDTVPKVKEEIDKATKRLGDKGRVLVRYSGTEPKLRVMAEGEDEKLISTLVDDIIECIKKELG